jgi:hypothetical protein
MRIWTPDVPPIIKVNRAGTTIECKDYILEVPGGGKLPSRILSSITDLGRERTWDYFVAYYIINYGEVKKSDKIVLPLLRLQYPLPFIFVATEFAKVPVIRQSPPFLVGARLHRNIGLAQHERLVVK